MEPLQQETLFLIGFLILAQGLAKRDRAKFDFDVTFQSALFNLDANQSPVTLAGGLISPEWDGAQWTSNLPIGENGMTYAVDVDENE